MKIFNLISQLPPTKLTISTPPGCPDASRRPRHRHHYPDAIIAPGVFGYYSTGVREYDPEKAKDLLAKRGFDPVLGARPLRRTIQREIEDQLSEKILYGEIGAGEIISVDVEGWDGESKDNTKATFTFSPRPKPLPEGTFDEPLEDTEVRDNDGADAEGTDTIIPDTLPEEPVSSSNDDGNNPPPAGAGAPSGQ